jgi:hypothetical protein
MNSGGDIPPKLVLANVSNSVERSLGFWPLSQHTYLADKESEQKPIWTKANLDNEIIYHNSTCLHSSRTHWSWARCLSDET